MKTSDQDFQAKLNDLINYIFTPKAVQAKNAKRQKEARDAISVIEERKRIHKELYSYE